MPFFSARRATAEDVTRCPHCSPSCPEFVAATPLLYAVDAAAFESARYPLLSSTCSSGYGAGRLLPLPRLMRAEVLIIYYAAVFYAVL